LNDAVAVMMMVVVVVVVLVEDVHVGFTPPLPGYRCATHSPSAPYRVPSAFSRFLALAQANNLGI